MESARFSFSAAIEALTDRPEIVKSLMAAVRRSNGRHTFETLVRDLAEGRAAIFIKENAAIVTELVRYPTGAMWLAARIGVGKLSILETMVADLEEHAKAKGYAGVEATGRTGFARVGLRHGYSESHRFIEKAL